MDEPARVIGWSLLVFSLIGAVYTICAGLAVGWFFARPRSRADDFVPVTILKPLHGDEPGLRECLEGFCTQDYPAAVHLVFGVRDATDTAIPVVRALTLDHPDLDIDLVVDARLYGANLKVSNLINMEPFIRHPLVVLADSDVAVRPDYLRTVTADLARPEIGFVTCAFVGRPTGNFWSRFTAMSIDYHFLPSVAFGLRLKLAKPCFGPTIAMRRSTLERIGGFRPFVDHLADDFEIGRRIRALGLGFVVPPEVIGHGCPERSAHSMASHELRWARTIQVIDPLSYLGSAVCHPLPWALLAAVLLRGAAISDAALAAVLLSRAFLAGRVDRAVGGRSRGAWWLPARDLLSVAIYLCAFLGRTVGWRGRRFQIGPGGVLVPQGRHTAEPAAGPAWVALAPTAMPTRVADVAAPMK